MKSFILLFLGAIGVLSFSPYNFWPASIISLTGLLAQILYSTWKKIIWYALLWGIGFFGSGLYWIYISINQFSSMHCYISFFLVIFLILYLTLFPILFSILLFWIISPTVNIWKFIGLSPVLWSITEYFRGNLFTGFPWLQFGYSQIDGPLKGIAPILGVEGITFILVLISTLLSVAIKNFQIFPIFLSIVTLLLLYPLTWIQWYHLQPQRSTKISLIQGNINQCVKWDTNYTKKILKKYLDITYSTLGNTKIIIWPESAIPDIEIYHNHFLTKLDNLLRKYQTNLITGIIDMRFFNKSYNYYNSIIVLGNSVPYKYPSINRYDKHHLVLFSEIVPSFNFFFKLLSKLCNITIFPTMQPGKYLQPQLIVSKLKITAAICYEMILGYQIYDNFRSDTDFLLTIANNAWFGNSIEPWQYFQMIRMRALEFGRPVICSTNNGITAIIEANGSIYAQLPQFKTLVLSANVVPTTGNTPYSKYGANLFWCCNIFTIILFYIIAIIKK